MENKNAEETIRDSLDPPGGWNKKQLGATEANE
jgi:hypothetical protein